VGVRKRRENLALARHAFDEVRLPEREVRQLQGHRAIQDAVRALREPHRAHTAAADLADQPIGSDRIARAAGRRTQRSILFIRDANAGHRGEEIVRFDLGGAREECAQSRLERRVLGRQRIEPGEPLGGRKGERRVQEPAELGPGHGIFEDAIHDRAPPFN
jgi:hypothetical protein